MKSRRKQPDDPRRCHDPQQCHDRDDGEQRRESGAGQFPGIAFRFKSVILGEDRDERRGHGAFGE